MDKQPLLSAERQKLLAQRLKGASKPASEARQISKRNREKPVPLSAGQHQMWVIDQMNPGSAAYNIPVAYRLRGTLDIRALDESFNKIIERHEIWRTTFRESGGDAVQEIQAEYRLQLNVISLEHLPFAERAPRASALAADEAAKPFDLRRLPLVHVSLLRLAQDDHVLLINLHHIVGDGLSLGAMFDELDTFYRAASAGRTAVLPELAVQYADFAVWQRQELTASRLAPQLEFWRRQLQGELPVLELPTDKPRPSQQSFAGSTLDFSLPKDLVQKLTAIGAKHSATFFVTIHAAFQVILLRYSKAEQIVIGTPVANRPFRELDKLIGDFINVLPLRCDLSGNPTFVELLQKSRDLTLDALSCKDVPFETLVHELKQSRDPSRNPIFQTLLQVLPAVQTRLGELSVTVFEFEQRSTQVDLALNFYEEAEGSYIGRFQYSTELFTKQTIAMLLANFLRLLHEIVRDPEQRILEIPILAERERELVLREWNQTAVEYPSEATVQMLFQQQAARTPDAIAVKFCDEQLTYRELDQRADVLSSHLHGLGAAPGILVGVCVERCAEMIVAVLAVLKAGAAYVPLDPALPAARLALMVEDAALPLIVTQNKLIPALPAHGSTVVCLDDPALRVALPASTPITDASPDDLAYVIFTSGSTGRPKGVEITHRGLTNYLCSMQRAPGMTAEDVVLAITTLSFDISTLEIFLPLITGASVVVISRETALDGWALIGEIERQGATLLQATPTTWRLLLETPWQKSPKLRALIGGEACPRELAVQLLEKCGELWNMYGPTETTVWSTIERLTLENEPISIGRPIANTTIYILDAHLQPTPIGVPGELHIGGVGLARGYRNREALTAEKFIADPFSDVPGARLYKTGDLARYLPDGRLECLGRLDHQIKLRGFRIEPGEIEAVLKEQSSIRDAAVVLRGEGASQRLVAYCVRHGAEISSESLQANLTAALSDRLPYYMIPSAFVFLEAMPLTPSAKIDRRALPEPGAEASTTRVHAPPQNSVHAHLIEIWEEVLNRKPIGIRDDFFEIGGHSLLAARVIALTTERLGHRLPFAEFFANPTIEAHARRLFHSQVAVPQIPYALINPEGKRTAVFFFHGDFVGGGFFCKTLASAIGSDRPFYALHPHGLQGDAVPPTIEAMAMDRLKQIREIQPHGPYLIGGYCNGALIAFHAARLLREAGEEVATLLMVNAVGTNVRFGWLKRSVAIWGALRGEDEASTLKRFLHSQSRLSYLEHLSAYYFRAAVDLLKQPPREQVLRVWRKACRIAGRPLRANAAALARKTEHPPATVANLIPQGPLGEFYNEACRAFIPLRSDAPIVLLWPRDEPPQSSRGPAAGWEKVCSQISVMEVPGHHHSCISLNANVVQVGLAMRKAIDQAESLLSST
jgi:amino acid adenylation domain-containing protein